MISVDVKTGEVTLWDSKYRTSETIIQESPTFTKEGPLTGALNEAEKAIKGSTLPQAIKDKAVQNLIDNTYTTNTVGAGNVKNSVTTKICNGKICGE